MKTQSDVAQVRVRPIQPQERKRFERWMEEHHYLSHFLVTFIRNLLIGNDLHGFCLSYVAIH
jgi:hypothetical protein